MAKGKNPYENFSKDELILRDHLAMDRTILANERTLLAYVRTSLAIIVVGVTIIHFLSEKWTEIVGITLNIVGVAVLAIGFFRYKKMDSSLNKTKDAT